jgi:hypothetical protein
MAAFRFFDPWAALENSSECPAPAKVANPAKAETAAPGSLAALAGLAAKHAETAFSGTPAELIPREALTAWGEAEEERAGIVEHDGAIPRSWAEGFARLDPDRPPGDVPPRRWQRFIDDVGLFLDSPFCAVAAGLGWGPFDLFGCDRDRPFARIDKAGLLWLLNGDRIAMLAHDTAAIATQNGTRLTYRRKPTEPDRALAWELAR